MLWFYCGPPTHTQNKPCRDFTDLLVFNEDRKSINGMLLVHLPEGPTAQFRLSNLVLSKDIKVGAKGKGWACWAAAGPAVAPGQLLHLLCCSWAATRPAVAAGRLLRLLRLLRELGGSWGQVTGTRLGGLMLHLAPPKWLLRLGLGAIPCLPAACHTCRATAARLPTSLSSS